MDSYDRPIQPTSVLNDNSLALYVGKYFLDPHTDLPCIVHRAILWANQEVFRAYYINRYDKPSSISIPPLMNKSHVLPLIEEFRTLCTELADNATFPKISESSLFQIDHSTGKEEYELPIKEKPKERYIIDSQTDNADMP